MDVVKGMQTLLKVSNIIKIVLGTIPHMNLDDCVSWY